MFLDFPAMNTRLKFVSSDRYTLLYVLPHDNLCSSYRSRPLCMADWLLMDYDWQKRIKSYPTFNGLPNMYGFLEDRLLDKIIQLGRISIRLWICSEKLTKQLPIINNQHHYVAAVEGLKALRSACVGLAQKYNYFIESQDQANLSFDAPQCLKDIQTCLQRINYSAHRNPVHNLTGYSLNFIMRLFDLCCRYFEDYVVFIDTTYKAPNVQ